MKTNVRLLILLAVVLFATGLVHGQYRRGVTQNDFSAIKAQVDDIFGPGVYSVYDVMNVDSTKEPGSPEGIEDPYGTLSRCYVFLAVGMKPSDLAGGFPKGFIGVWKEQQIVWRSEPAIDNTRVIEVNIESIRDLNRDGKVDIVSVWREGNRGDDASVWVFAWDGTAGTVINEVDGNRSAIVSIAHSLHIVDVDGDGIMEITGEWISPTDPTDYQRVTFGWNGQLYVNLLTPPSPSPSGSLPKNLAVVTVTASVSRPSIGQLFFQYVVENRPASLQKLENFSVLRRTDSTQAGTTRRGWRPMNRQKVPSILWMDRFRTNLMVPGERESTFTIRTAGLPTITSFYAQGNNGRLNLNDLFSNSVTGPTIGPADPPRPLAGVAFIDTIASFAARLFSVGWCTNETTAAKYMNYLASAKTNVQENNLLSARADLDRVLADLVSDRIEALSSEGWALLQYNTEYLLNHLSAGSPVSTYSLFATHSLWLEQNSDVHSGDIGANEAGSAPFLDSQVELSVGIGTSTASGFSIKANRIKVKQGATVRSDVYYNELENNGTITGTQHTPLTLPLVSILPEFKTATPGSQNITIPQNGTQTLSPGSYGDILVRRNGKLTLTGGVYHLGSLNTGDNVQILFQAPSEVRIAGRFDTDQGTSVGPEDTTSLSANQIVFYIGGINGSNGNLGATPKAAQIGLSNTVKANFYVPNGTLWIRQNSKATGAFIGKDVDVGIGVKIWHKSVF